MDGSLLRRILLYLLRVGFAALMLFWLIRSGRLDPEVFRQLRPDARDWALLGLGAAAIFLGLLALSLRLLRLLGAIGVHVRFARAVRVTLLGTFFGTILPGLVGGDVVKAAALCKGLSTGRRLTVGTVLTDRIIGLYSFFLLAGLGILYGYLTHQMPEIPRTILAIPILISVGAPLGFVVLGVVGLRITKWLPSSLMERIDPVLASLQSLQQSPSLLLVSVLLSLTNHFLLVVAFTIVGEVMGLRAGVAEHWILDPLALTLNALPFSPGGLGIAEGGFSYLYGMVGVEDGAALGVLGRALAYFVYVMGGIAAMILPETLEESSNSERVENP